jgi:hypothetical protein
LRLLTEISFKNIFIGFDIYGWTLLLLPYSIPTSYNKSYNLDLYIRVNKPYSLESFEWSTINTYIYDDVTKFLIMVLIPPYVNYVDYKLKNELLMYWPNR